MARAPRRCGEIRPASACRSSLRGRAITLRRGSPRSTAIRTRAERHPLTLRSLFPLEAAHRADAQRRDPSRSALITSRVLNTRIPHPRDVASRRTLVRSPNVAARERGGWIDANPPVHRDPPGWGEAGRSERLGSGRSAFGPLGEVRTVESVHWHTVPAACPQYVTIVTEWRTECGPIVAPSKGHNGGPLLRTGAATPLCPALKALLRRRSPA